MRWPNHVLLGSDEFHHGVVELGPFPTIHTPLRGRIPIEGLGNVVGEVAHIAPPSVTVIQESDVGVDVGPAAPTSRDDLILHDWNGVINIVKGAVGLDDEREREL